MPTYEYECRKCGHRFERFLPVSARDVRTCPECGGRVRRLLSAGGAVMIKGSARSASPTLPCGRDAPCCGADGVCPSRPCDD